jgi:hypothetical protein
MAAFIEVVSALRCALSNRKPAVNPRAKLAPVLNKSQLHPRHSQSA